MLDVLTINNLHVLTIMCLHWLTVNILYVSIVHDIVHNAGCYILHELAVKIDKLLNASVIDK